MPRKPKPKRHSGEWFGGGLGGLFDPALASVKTPPPDPDEPRMLAFLRESSKHLAWLQVRFADPKGVIEALRKKGHVIKSVTWPNYSDWVYALSEGGYLYGPNGRKHEDTDTQGVPGKKRKS